MTERDLVRRAQSGDHDAFKILHDRHRPRLYRLCMSMLEQDHDRAEDCLQEAWLRCFMKLSSFRGDAMFGTWMYRLTWNEALMQIRKHSSKGKRHTFSLDDPCPVPEGREANTFGEMLEDTDSRLESAVDRIALTRLIAQLPMGMRRVIESVYLEGNSHAETGALIGRSTGTSKSQADRGREKLKKGLERKAFGRAPRP